MCELYPSGTSKIGIVYFKEIDSIPMNATVIGTYDEKGEEVFDKMTGASFMTFAETLSWAHRFVPYNDCGATKPDREWSTHEKGITQKNGVILIRNNQ